MTTDANGETDFNRAVERRSSERTRLSVEVGFESANFKGAALTREIGLGGLYLATDVELLINAQLKLSFRLGENDLRVNGIVVYQDAGAGVGIRFLNLSDETKAVLKRELPEIETATVSLKKR